MVKNANQRRFALNLIITFGLATTLAMPTDAQVLQDPLRDVVKPVEQARQQVEQRVQERLLEDARLDAELADVVDVVELAEDTARRTLQSTTGEALFVEVTLPNGDPVIEREWLVLATADLQTTLRALGANVVDEKKLSALGMTLLRFRVPEQLDSREQLEKHLPAHIHGSLSRHFVYRAQASTKEAEPRHSDAQLQQAKWCDAEVKIGMVDTKIMADHAAFAHQPITQKTFTDARLEQPVAHGTAVAGLLVGRSKHYASLLPNARLYNGAVFYRQDALHQGAALMPLLEALNWLAEAQVKVINVSLTGPNSPLFAQAVKQLANKGVVLVAAAGNNGPLAPAVYPAAYEDVIGVTAVAADQSIYRWANHGDYIEFASLGVRITTARRDGNTGFESGTSMAAPVVAAAAACWLENNSGASLAALRSFLQGSAEDLGETGHDSVFGHGLIATKQRASK